MTPPDPADPGEVVKTDGADSAPSVDKPEYESIADFAEYLADDDRTTYWPADIIRLMRRTRLSREAVVAGLAEYGFTPRAR